MIVPTPFSAATVRAALDALFPHGGVVEVRIPNTRHGTVSGYFDNKDRLVAAVAPWDGKANLYVTLNPVLPDLLARAKNRLKKYVKTSTKDEEIVSRHWLPIDVDPVRSADISSTDEELANAVARRDAVVGYLCNNGFPEMVLADSGNGAHALVCCSFEHTPEITDLFKRALLALDSRYSDVQVKIDKGVFNAARICKLYGTLATKGDSTATRPHRRATITRAPERLEPLTRERLEWLAAQAPAPVNRTYSLPPEQRRGAIDVRAEFQNRGLYLRPLASPKHAVTCPWVSEHSTASGVTETAIFEPATPGDPWGFKCFHAHCPERTIKDVLAFFGNGTKSGASLPDTTSLLAPLTSLTKSASLETVESALRTVAGGLAGADGLRRATVREGALKALERLHLSSPTKLVDAALATPKETGNTHASGDAVFLPDPEPWPNHVDGALLLGAITGAITRFVSLPKEAADTVALWIVNAHAHDAGDVSPILAANSAVKRCGKTTLLSVVAGLVPRPLPTSNITASAIFRAVQKFTPTLLVDEADTFLALSEETRGILNSGHAKQTAVTVRNVGDHHETRLFSTWCPKAIALIGKLPDTLADRSIIVTMKRKTRREATERFRVKKLDELEPLCRQAARWAKDNLDALSLADPEVPDELDDRAADNWRPLLAIAALAGGDWLARAHAAALALSSHDTRGDSEIGVLLLGDLREMFYTGVNESGERKTRDPKDIPAGLPSAEILRNLIALEERPWADWQHGKSITTRHLSRLLEPFGIKPKALWVENKTVRGYELKGLGDAFSRYLPFYPQGPQESNNDEDLGDNSICKDPPLLRIQNMT